MEKTSIGCVPYVQRTEFTGYPEKNQICIPKYPLRMRRMLILSLCAQILFVRPETLLKCYGLFYDGDRMYL